LTYSDMSLVFNTDLADPRVNRNIILMADSPLHLTISGHTIDVVKNEDGSVIITIRLGAFGDQTFKISANQWAQIVAYTSSAMP
jgi:hypothetical protein